MDPYYYGNYPPPQQAGPNPQFGMPHTFPITHQHAPGSPGPSPAPHMHGHPSAHYHGGPVHYSLGPYNHLGQPIPHYPPGYTGYIPPGSPPLPHVQYMPPPTPITTVNEFFGLPPYAQNPELHPQAPYPVLPIGPSHEQPAHNPPQAVPADSEESGSEEASGSASGTSLGSANSNASMTNEQQQQEADDQPLASTVHHGEQPTSSDEDDEPQDITARLPDQVLLEICKYLGPKDLASLSSCHPKLARICRDRSLWSKQLNIYEPSLVTEIMDVFTVGGDKFHHIVLYNYMAVNSALNFIADRCPNMESVTILSEQPVELGNATIYYLMDRLQHLREITLWGVNVHPDYIKHMLASSHGSLKELTIYYHPGMRYYADTMPVPLSVSGLHFHAMSYVDLTGLDVRTEDLTLLLRGSPEMRGFVWSAQTSTQILAVIETIPQTLTTFGIDIMFGTYDEEVPEVGTLLESIQATERIEEFRVSAPDNDQFLTLARQVFGGNISWPNLRTVACMKRGLWQRNDMINFRVFPETITKLIMHCDVPDEMACLIVDKLPNLEFLHVEVDMPNRGRFLSIIANDEQKLAKLKYLFISRQSGSDVITHSLQDLVVARPKLRVTFTQSPGIGKTVFFNHPETTDAEVARWAMFHRCVGDPLRPELAMIMN